MATNSTVFSKKEYGGPVIFSTNNEQKGELKKRVVAADVKPTSPIIPTSRKVALVVAIVIALVFILLAVLASHGIVSVTPNGLTAFKAISGIFGGAAILSSIFSLIHGRHVVEGRKILEAKQKLDDTSEDCSLTDDKKITKGKAINQLIEDEEDEEEFLDEHESLDNFKPTKDNNVQVNKSTGKPPSSESKKKKTEENKSARKSKKSENRGYQSFGAINKPSKSTKVVKQKDLYFEEENFTVENNMPILKKDHDVNSIIEYDDNWIEKK